MVRDRKAPTQIFTFLYKLPKSAFPLGSNSEERELVHPVTRRQPASVVWIFPFSFHLLNIIQWIFLPTFCPYFEYFYLILILRIFWLTSWIFDVLSAFTLNIPICCLLLPTLSTSWIFLVPLWIFWPEKCCCPLLWLFLFDFTTSYVKWIFLVPLSIFCPAKWKIWPEKCCCPLLWLFLFDVYYVKWIFLLTL